MISPMKRGSFSIWFLVDKALAENQEDLYPELLQRRFFTSWGSKERFLSADSASESQLRQRLRKNQKVFSEPESVKKFQSLKTIKGT